MTNEKRPFVWEMVKEAVEDLGGKTTNIAVRNWILDKYPGTNISTINCQIIVCTVNHYSRIHYSENQKPRQATSRCDLLYRPATGEIEWYDPSQHGLWEIFEQDDGKLIVQKVGTEPTTPQNDGDSFAAEAHLRDYLAKNLEIIEEGLQHYVDDNGQMGVEFSTPIGRIDLLTVDTQGGYLVIELKLARGPDQVCGQILRYVGWVKRHMARDKPVRGLIIAQHISDKIRYALTDIPNINFLQYKLNITLENVPDLDNELKIKHV